MRGLHGHRPIPQPLREGGAVLLGTEGLATDAEVIARPYCRRRRRIDRSLRDRRVLDLIGRLPPAKFIPLTANCQKVSKSRENFACVFVGDRTDILEFTVIEYSGYGPERTTDLPRLWGSSDFGAPSGRQGQAHVPVL